MAKSKEYEKLLRKREKYVQSILNHEAALLNTNQNSSQAINFASTILPLVEECYEKYKEVNESLIDHDDFAESDVDPPDNRIVEKYVALATTLKNILKKEQQMMGQNQNQAVHDLELPSMAIPIFSGDTKEWSSFYDIFSTYIDKSAIADVSKMHYLKSHVKGSALKMIQNYPTTENNYRIAWKTLCDRYDNKRKTVNDCLRTFMQLKLESDKNATNIRDLIDTTTQAIKCIEAQGIETDAWSPILVYILQSKFGTYLTTEWEKELKGQHDLPSFTRIIEFLETQYRIFESVPIQEKIEHKQSNSTFKANGKENWRDKTKNSNNNKDECAQCHGPHYILFCPEFNDLSVNGRLNVVKEKKLCTICLHKHDVSECRSKYKCSICKGNHSTKLHDGNTINMHAIQTQHLSKKLLATAIVKVIDKRGEKHLLRAFIDGLGSEGNVITEKAAQMLGLKRKRENVPLTGLGGNSLGKATSSVRLQVQSAINNQFNIVVDAFVKKSITSSQSHRTGTEIEWDHLKGIPLADPHFMNSNQIDLLLDVEVYSIIIENGIRKGGINEPVAQKSALGWLVFGVVSPESQIGMRIHATSISDNLRRFWENEEVQLKPILTEEQSKCVEHCKKTTIRLPDGRIQTSLPFNMDRNDKNFLGDTRRMALKRFFSLEKKV